MIFWILKWAIYSIALIAAALIGQALIKDLVCYLFWLKNYKKQGIEYNFIPVLGLMYYFLADLHPLFENMKALEKYKIPIFKKSDVWVKFRDLAERMKKKGSDMIAVNYRKSRPILIIYNPDLVVELMSQDNDKLLREFPVDLPFDLGFVTSNGPQALHIRSIFAKFFYTDCLENYTPKMFKIITDRLDKLKKGIQSGILHHEVPEGYDTSCNIFDDIC